MRWPVLLVASILVSIVGFVLAHLGGRGYGRTTGPSTFAEVDAGGFAPRERPALDRPPGRRWTRTWRNVYASAGIGELLLAALFGLAIVLQPSTARSFLPVTVILGVVGLVLIYHAWRAAQKDKLHDIGLEGEARVVGIEQTGIQMNDNQYVRLDLVVHVDGHPDYEVKHNEIVPEVALGRLTNGEELPVRVDPAHPSHLVVQWERL